MPNPRYTGPAIKVDSASFNYKEIRAVDKLSLEVPQGISFGLLGPNGSGKTTLIRLLVGLLRPGSGSIRIFGRRHSRSLSRHIGYMPQLSSLYAELSIYQNVDFFARIYGIRDKVRRRRLVMMAIKLVDLWPRRNDSIHKLSGGMKQRVSLACAIAHAPRLLFLDEPTVGVDPALRVTFWDFFKTLTDNPRRAEAGHGQTRRQSGGCVFVFRTAGGGRQGCRVTLCPSPGASYASWSEIAAPWHSS
jgi:ABC-2 type transport system ATP-binding protein